MIPWRYSTTRSPFSWCPSRNVRSYAIAYADTSFVDLLVRSTTADRLSGARRTALTSIPMVTVCAFARVDKPHRTIATNANNTSFDWLIVHFLYKQRQSVICALSVALRGNLSHRCITCYE